MAEQDEKTPAQKTIDQIYKNQELYEEHFDKHLGNVVLARAALETEKRKALANGESLTDSATGNKIVETYASTLYDKMLEQRGRTASDPLFRNVELQEIYGQDMNRLLQMGLQTKFSNAAMLSMLESEDNIKYAQEKYMPFMKQNVNPELQTDMIKEIGADKYIDLKRVLNKPETLDGTIQAVLASEKGKATPGPDQYKKMGLGNMLKTKYVN